jgi:3-oxoacyl-[acyl-carrier protein] reductase
VKSALITGGSSGIGLGIAEMLKDESYELTLVARRADKLVRAAAALGAEPMSANVTHEDDCARVVAAHAKRWGRLDVLVNCAGVGAGGPFEQQGTKRIDLQLDVNLRGTLLITREALPLLKAARGIIVTLASIAGLIPVQGRAVYGATKAALIAFTNSLNREEAASGVRATAVCPAFVATSMAAWTKLPTEELIPVEDVSEVVRMLLQLSPSARVPQVIVERMASTADIDGL